MVMKKKIVVSGANGQLGMEFRELAPSFPFLEFIFLTREELPVQDEQVVRRLFQQLQPSYFINCAAYTAVDKAESEEQLAFEVNAKATGVLATAAAEFFTRFIHISTDYVFDGTAQRPYKEDDPTNPQSVYGFSKLEGERMALQANPDALIIRTAWVYSEFGKNFVKTMLRLMKEKESINVVNDQVGSPTYAADLATAILQIITSGEWVPGIYHYSNSGVISWYDFAVAIRDYTGSHCQVHPIPSSQYPTPAKRPAYSVLDTSRIRAQYGIDIPEWRTSLTFCLQEIAHAH